MADFNKVKIGTVWLTDDGLETGDACMIEIPEMPLMQSEWIGFVERSANATPKGFRAPSVGQGITLNITAFIMDKTIHESIMTILNGIDPDTETVEVTIEGAWGDYELLCWPEWPSLVKAPGTFSDEWLDQVTYPLVVVGPNP